MTISSGVIVRPRRWTLSAANTNRAGRGFGALEQAEQRPHPVHDRHPIRHPPIAELRHIDAGRLDRCSPVTPDVRNRPAARWAGPRRVLVSAGGNGARPTLGGAALTRAVGVHYRTACGAHAFQLS